MAAAAAARRRGTHVPKFGSWDANNHAPYTAVFDTARAGRGSGGKMINPNDPEALQAEAKQQPAQPAIVQQRKEGGHESPARRQRSPHHTQSGINRSAAGTFNSRSRTRSGSETNTTTQPPEPEKPALPKFGQWDNDDPSSGAGFTVIFNNARTEKKAGGAARVPEMHPRQDSPPRRHGRRSKHHRNNSSSSSGGSGWFCCCFS